MIYTTTFSKSSAWYVKIIAGRPSIAGNLTISPNSFRNEMCISLSDMLWYLPPGRLLLINVNAETLGISVKGLAFWSSFPRLIEDVTKNRRALKNENDRVETNLFDMIETQWINTKRELRIFPVYTKVLYEYVQNEREKWERN